MNKLPSDIRLLAIDADDTLWDNQSYFEKAEAEYCKILEPWAREQTVRESLYELECANMPYTGYGTKAFTLSLIENAIDMSNNEIPAKVLQQIMYLGLDILEKPIEPLPGVEKTLKALYNSKKYILVCFTKGDANEQENKFMKSGLSQYIDDIYVTAFKEKNDYMRLCIFHRVKPAQTLSIGNSFKSDIHPIIDIGGYGIHIPQKRMWQYEHIEEYQHPKVLKLQQFADIMKYLEV